MLLNLDNCKSNMNIILGKSLTFDLICQFEFFLKRNDAISLHFWQIRNHNFQILQNVFTRFLFLLENWLI